MNMLNRAASAALVFTLLVPLGCRTYGGYGSVDANNEQLRAVAQSFVASASAAERDADRLAAISGLDARYVNAFRAVATQHADAAARIAGELEEDASFGYRGASRKLGAVVSEQRQFSDQYQSILRAIIDDSGMPSAERTARYQVVPASYFRAAQRTITVDDVIQAAGQR